MKKKKEMSATVQLGERRTVRPATISFGERGYTLPTTGTVVYIHPEGRYCTLEFEIGRGERVRESFLLIKGRIAG